MLALYIKTDALECVSDGRCHGTVLDQNSCPPKHWQLCSGPSGRCSVRHMANRRQSGPHLELVLKVCCLSLLFQEWADVVGFRSIIQNCCGLRLMLCEAKIRIPALVPVPDNTLALGYAAFDTQNSTGEPRTRSPASWAAARRSCGETGTPP